MSIKRNADLNAMSSSALMWCYGLLPAPTRFDIWGQERAFAKVILANRGIATSDGVSPIIPAPPREPATENLVPPTVTQSAPLDTLRPIRNKPGRSPVKLANAVNAMIAAVSSGKITINALRQMKQKSLCDLYLGAGRTLLQKARCEALRQLRSKDVSDRSPTY